MVEKTITIQLATVVGSLRKQKVQSLPLPASDNEHTQFDCLVREHQLRITRLAQRLLGWDEDVQAVVQDVFLAAWQHRNNFRGDANINTWLTTITVNRCRKTWRRRKVRIKWFNHVQQNATQNTTASAQTELIADEKFKQVRKAVQQLPTKYREVTVLRYLEEMEIDQIAAVLKVSRNTIDVRLNRARAKLKTILGETINE